MKATPLIAEFAERNCRPKTSDASRQVRDYHTPVLAIDDHGSRGGR
jgi:hypothetical protein